MIDKSVAQSTTASLLILLIHIAVLDALSIQLDQRTARHMCALGRVHYIKRDLPVPSIQVTSSVESRRLMFVDILMFAGIFSTTTM